VTCRVKSCPPLGAFSARGLQQGFPLRWLLSTMKTDPCGSLVCVADWSLCPAHISISSSSKRTASVVQHDACSACCSSVLSIRFLHSHATKPIRMAQQLLCGASTYNCMGSVELSREALLLHLITAHLLFLVLLQLQGAHPFTRCHRPNGLHG
jgi:hypothetical protein